MTITTVTDTNEAAMEIQAIETGLARGGRGRRGRGRQHRGRGGAGGTRASGRGRGGRGRGRGRRGGHQAQAAVLYDAQEEVTDGRSQNGSYKIRHIIIYF